MNVDLLAGASRARARVRAERGAGSLPFIVMGVATTVLGVFLLAGVSSTDLALAPAVAFPVLLGVIWVRSNRRGIGLGTDGYVFLAIIGGLTLIAYPLSMVVGAATLIGAGLSLLGARGKDLEMGAAGTALAVVGLLTMRPLSMLDGAAAGSALLAAGMTVALFGVMRVRAEHRLLNR